MNLHEFLIDTLYFLVATLVFIPIFRWLKLGSILGYIIAGILIGPTYLGLINNSQSIFQFADLGIILLLFMVGLELSSSRLKVLKNSIIFEGGLQMLLTTFIFYAIGLNLGLSSITSILTALSLALSSTAFALSYLTDSSQITMSHGQTSLSILLFQDLLIVPILALIPLLNTNGNSYQELNISFIGIKFVLFFAIIILFYFTLNPIIHFIRKTQNQEIFLASFLFLVIGMAIGMEKIGLSKAIGSFIAGVFLAGSEIKKDIKSIATPFKSILMGVFFMALGIDFDFKFLIENFTKIILLSVLILLIKIIILILIGKIKNGNYESGLKVGLLISQGGEFGIVVLASALQFNLVNQNTVKTLSSCIIATMIFAPLLARLTETLNLNNKVENKSLELEKNQDSLVTDLK